MLMKQNRYRVSYCLRAEWFNDEYKDLQALKEAFSNGKYKDASSVAVFDRWRDDPFNSLPLDKYQLDLLLL